MALCSGIKADGRRCGAQAITDSQYCFNHSPEHAEARKQRNSKGGRRGGRGRPIAELANLKTRLSDLADDVLAGRVDRGNAAVAGQLLNTVIRAVGVELKVREQTEFIERLEALERAGEGQRGGKRWGA